MSDENNLKVVRKLALACSISQKFRSKAKPIARFCERFVGADFSSQKTPVLSLVIHRQRQLQLFTDPFCLLELKTFVNTGKMAELGR